MVLWFSLVLWITTLMIALILYTHWKRNHSIPVEPVPLTQVDEWERTLTLVEVGDSTIWVCDDPDCAEGCTDPTRGIGLLLKEAKQTKGD